MAHVVYMYAWMFMDIQCNYAKWTNAFPYVIMQGVDLNMVPTVEESAPQCETKPVERMSSRDYQISLIEARGPNSRGVQMLRAGLLSLDKHYVPPPVTSTVQNRSLNAHGVELNETKQLDGSTPKGSLRITRPLATRESQIALIESASPNSRGVCLLRAGMADKAKTEPPEPVQATVSLPVEAMPHIRNYSEGQYYRIYPKYGWQM